MRGKIYSIYYYTARQAEYEKVNIFHEIYGIPNLEETVVVAFRNESLLRNDKYN